ncbi:MAG: hypothetical protein MR598_02130 [Erysipelotrichaceae bacterium]|nr:hypothetical protein [Erysipelotrichaceae bacterium]
MTNQIMTYYIPNNPNIPKGHIYTLYLNNNTNLDLSSILNTQTITLNSIIDPTKPSKKETSQIIISKEDYTRLLELNNIAYQLSTKRTVDIQKFIQEETKTTTELSKINTERQQLIKKLTKEKDVA